MKKLTISFLCTVLTISVQAQVRGLYHVFTDIKTVAATPVKDQNKSGTCWSFATLGLMESELLRMGKGEYDLSAMWVARHTYYEKVIKYVRMHGNIILTGGGVWEDVPNVIRKYGIVPTTAYNGLNYGSPNHNHAELDTVIIAYANAVIKGKVLTTAWQDGLNGILDAYFGKVPEKFEYNGKRYTPESFRDMLGLNMDDYICLSSFTHHPFYTSFNLEIPDNWNMYPTYNITQEELLDVATGAIDKGYAALWSSDVSESGFSYYNGIAFNMPEKINTAEGAEMARWTGVDPKKQASIIIKLLLGPIAERNYTQAERQLAFDNYETTEDHSMLLVGKATDQDGKPYFKVKNSWAATGAYKGYFYASHPYFMYKTICVVVHKDVLPKELRRELGIK